MAVDPRQREGVKAWPPWSAGALVALVVVAVHLTLAIVAHPVFSGCAVVGEDGFLRLLQARGLLETGDWYERRIPGLNAPYGLTLPLSRPVDGMILLLALPLRPVLGVDAALCTAGAVTGPILHVMAALLLAWAARPLIGRRGSILAALATLASPVVLSSSQTGEAIDSMALSVPALAAFGLLLRSLLERHDGEVRGALMAGVFLGLALWTGGGSLPFLLACLMVAGSAWLVAGRAALHLNLILARSLFLTVLAAFLAERGLEGPGGGGLERLSLFHAGLLVLPFAFWRVVSDVTGRMAREPSQLVRGALMAVAVALTAAMTTRASAALFGPSSDEGWTFLPIVLAAAGISIWSAAREPQTGRRLAWSLVGGTILVLGAFVAGGRGSAGLSALLVTIPLAALAERALRSLEGRAVAGVAAAFLLLVPLQALEGWGRLSPPPPGCRVSDVLPLLPEQPGGVVLAPGPLTAALHYTTGTGVADVDLLLEAGDEAKALRLVRERGVGHVILCHDGDASGFGRSLLTGDGPSWLRPVDRGQFSQDGPRVYAVDEAFGH